MEQIKFKLKTMLLYCSMAILAMAGINNAVSAQQNVPVIRANSVKVSIKDGDEAITKYWDHLNSKVKPVVYSLSKTSKERIVSFFTDIDSISFHVFANKKYDFRVILNNKDTCYAQLSTIIPAYYKDCNQCNITNDTIPFLLGDDKMIHLKGSVNNSGPLDLIFDTGASVFVLTEKGKRKVKITLDGATENLGTGGFSTESTSSSNTLQLSALKWKNLPMLYIDYHGGVQEDGIVGFNIFEDKVVEIDYEKQIIILHKSLPDTKNHYTMLPMRHSIDGSRIPVSLYNSIHQSTGWFLFDTGGDLTVAVGGDFASKNDLYGTMKVQGSVNVSGTGHDILKSDIVILPKISLAGYTLTDMPILLGGKSVAYSGNDGILAMGTLMRFNTLIDYQGSKMYIKPNSLFTQPFKKKDSRIYYLGVSLLFLVIIILYFVVDKRNKKKRVSL